MPTPDHTLKATEDATAANTTTTSTTTSIAATSGTAELEQQQNSLQCLKDIRRMSPSSITRSASGSPILCDNGSASRTIQDINSAIDKKKKKVKQQSIGGTANGENHDDDDNEEIAGDHDNEVYRLDHDPIFTDFLGRGSPDGLWNHQKQATKLSYLRPGAKFVGSQQSGRSTYEVNVEIKNVNLEDAFVSGYFQIDGLTDSHPTMVTYFEAEIISDKYSFYTRRPEWGADEKIDMCHWNRFASWRNIADEARHPDYVHKSYMNDRFIYMRWKEYFLVPDHRVVEIEHASYAGFYYIAFDQVNGSILGYYFHDKSDRFQQLDLAYQDQLPKFPSYEFR